MRRRGSGGQAYCKRERQRQRDNLKEGESERRIGQRANKSESERESKGGR